MDERCEHICCVEHLERCDATQTEVCPDCGQETCEDHAHASSVICEAQETIRERTA